MSATSWTDWTVSCDAEEGCGESLGTHETDCGTAAAPGTAADVRRVLRRRGWAVSVPDSAGGRRRKDFCPAHRPLR